MLKSDKYLSNKKNPYTFASENKKQRIMKHRQFRTECICITMINDKLVICNDLRGIRKKIYTQGRRGEKYVIYVCDKRTEKIYDIYLMMYTKEGPIFTRQTFSRWKEYKKEAIARQKNLFID